MSTATPPDEDPERVVFFIDRALGSRRVAEALRAEGEVVEVHDDHHPQDTPDAAHAHSALAETRRPRPKNGPPICIRAGTGHRRRQS